MKENRFLSEKPNPQGTSALSKTQSSYKDDGDKILFDTTENIQHQGANPDEKKQKEIEYKKKTERNVWLTVPTNKLYIRNPDSLISEQELKAIKDKNDEYERIAIAEMQDKMDHGKAKAAIKKEAAKKEDSKDKDGQSTKGDKGKKDDKAQDPKSKKRQTKIINEDDIDVD